MSEHEEQVAVFEWADLSTGQYPELKTLYAIPNGGKRHKAVAGKLKAEGTKPGVPDIHLPVARGGYHSLYIEMKFGKYTPTVHQANWLGYLKKKGHAVAVCWDFYATQDVLEWYLEQPPTAVVLAGTETAMPKCGQWAAAL